MKRHDTQIDQLVHIPVVYFFLEKEIINFATVISQ